MRPSRLLIESQDPVHAAIDIGTNSFHLLVARVDEQGRFDVIAQEKEMVRLGHGSGDMSELSAGAIDRGVACLRRFRQLAEVFGAEVTAVATSAVREAANRDVFLRRARDEAGVQVQVISGVEEARLIHLGVIQALPVFDRRLIVMDIGGGSTELLIAEGLTVLGARSVKLGAIRLTDRFFPGGVGDRCGRHGVPDLREGVPAAGPAGHAASRSRDRGGQLGKRSPRLHEWWRRPAVRIRTHR